MPVSLKDLAARVAGDLAGDGAVEIHGVAGVREAVAGEIAYVALTKYFADAASSQASALIVGKDWDKPLPMPLIRVENPEAAFTKVAQLFAPPPVRRDRGIHPTAVIAPDATVGADASIGPFCVIESGARIGARATLHAHVVVGQGAVVGDDALLYPNVSIREYCVLGNRVILHNGTVIGSDGFGYAPDKQGVRHKIPQIGIVVVGDDVEMGANVTIDRARFGKTRIGNGVKIDNLVQIAHNVIIGDHAVIVAQVGIAGSSKIGSKAILAGQAGVAGHLDVGAGAVVAAQAGVTKDVPAGAFVMGFPAVPQKEAAVNYANVSRLPELKKRVAELEKRIAALEKRGT